MGAMRLLIMLLMFAAPMMAFAQNLSGTITDEQGKGIGSVSVVLIDAKGNPVATARSKADGTFSIAKKEGAVSMRFMHLGYERQEVKLSELKPKTMLRQKAVEIREVKVVPKGLQIRGDTLIYNVDSLRGKTDRSIEDVIARIPGIKIGTDGTIYYQDKQINRFYIDGVDLMGSKYSMASKNLSADKVQSVEVLQHHQPVKMLRGKQFSESAALNIVLKPDARGVWTGSLDIGGGSTLQGKAKLLRDDRAVGMFFGHKLHTLSMYKTNNSGEDIMQEVKPVYIGGTVGMNVPVLLSNVGAGYASIGDDSRSRFNESHAIATNWLTKLSKDATLRFQLTGYINRNKSEQHHVTRYLDVDSASVSDETYSSKAYDNNLSAELEYSLNSSIAHITNNFQSSFDFDHSSASTVLNGKSLGQKVRPHKFNFADKIEANKLLGKNILSLEAAVGYNYQPGRLLIHDGMTEHLNIGTMYGSLGGNYTFVFGSFALMTSSEVSYRQIRESVAWGDSADAVTYRSLDWDFGPTLSYNGGGIHANLTTGLTFTTRHIEGISYTNLLFTPNFRIYYSINRYWRVGANYRYNTVPGDFLTVSPLRVYTSYDNVSSGSSNFTASGSHSGGGDVGYTDAVHGINGSVFYSWRRSTSRQLYNSVLIDGVYEREAESYKSVSTSHTVRGGISKKFRWCRSRVGLSGSWRRSEYSYMLNHTPQKGHFDSYDVSLSLSANPWNLLELNCSGYGDFSRRRSSVTSKYYGGHFDVALTPGNWVFKLTNHLYTGADDFQPTSFFSDFNANYKTSSYEVSLKVDNLWGRDSYERHIIGAMSETYEYMELRPRQIIAKISFNF